MNKLFEIRSIARLYRLAGRFGLTVVMFAFASISANAQIQFHSDSKPVHVIELYTSEGCYSCPPADRWLSSLIDHPGLFKQFVPVSFHVDYWNYLGWPDRYSRPEFSDRQRRYNRLGQVSGVYTPGMFLDGYEWRTWRQSSKNALATGQRGKDSANSIGMLQVNYQAKQTTHVTYKAHSNEKPGKIYVALLGVGIEAPIARGENKGKTLHHDFVVLDLQEAKLKQNDQGDFVSEVPAFTTDLQAPKYALAAWVTTEKDNSPLQAAGGWLPATE